MNEEIEEYIAYLSKFECRMKPKMPNFDLSAYTDNEYLSVINRINLEYDWLMDEEVYFEYLRGE